MGTIRAGFSVFSIPIRVPRGNNELWALTDPPPLLSNLCALFVYLLALKYYLSTVLKASNTWQLHYILICLQLMNNLLKNMHQITKLSSDILKILKLDFDTCFLNISWPQVLVKKYRSWLKEQLNNWKSYFRWAPLVSTHCDITDGWGYRCNRAHFWPHPEPDRLIREASVKNILLGSHYFILWMVQICTIFICIIQMTKNHTVNISPLKARGSRAVGDPAVRPVKLSVTKVSTDIQQDVILKVMFLWRHLEVHIYLWQCGDVLRVASKWHVKMTGKNLLFFWLHLRVPPKHFLLSCWGGYEHQFNSWRELQQVKGACCNIAVKISSMLLGFKLNIHSWRPEAASFSYNMTKDLEVCLMEKKKKKSWQ